jgi:hypothetical protein
LKWADGDDDRAIFWLYGPAGSGKSTIAQTIAEQYADDRLAASFFFSRGQAGRTDVTNFFPTLAYQLAISVPSTQSPINEALQTNPSILSQNLNHQFRNLILNHIRPPRTLIVVVDGLDECEEEGSAALIQVLAGANLERPLPIRFFLTSRADERIQEAFELYSSNIYPLNLWESGAHGDIRAYLKDRFSRLYMRRHRLMRAVSLPWPSDSDLDKLVTKAEGLFIYASTLFKFVEDRLVLPHEKLKTVMERHNGLDSLYEQVLSDAPLSRTDLFRRIIGALLLLPAPPSINGLARLLRVDDAKILVHLQGCRSIVNIPDIDEDDDGDNKHDDDKTIQFFHTSLRDFLTDKGRSRTYFINPIEHHVFILDDCIQLMTNMFTSPSGSGQRSERLSHRPWALSYACDHWYHHMTYAVQDDGGIGHINSYFGASLVGFLADLKSNRFWLWNNGIKNWRGFFDVGNDVFALVSIIKVGPVNLHFNSIFTHLPMKKYSNSSKKLFDALCGVLKSLEVCSI